MVSERRAPSRSGALVFGLFFSFFSLEIGMFEQVVPVNKARHGKKKVKINGDFRFAGIVYDTRDNWFFHGVVSL